MNVLAATTAPAVVVPTPRPAAIHVSTVARVLWTFRTEIAWVFVFSMFLNLLMLTPTVYMLQVFDRVMSSGNLSTLLAVSVIAMVLLVLMSFSEWLRSRLLVRAGGRFDQAMNQRVFASMFREQLSARRRDSMRPITDLNFLRQFLTGTGALAVFDTPWTLVYIGVLFLMHPWLGWAAALFCVIQLLLAVGVHRVSSRRLKATQDLSIEASQVLQAKLRNAETVEAMGMRSDLRRQWLGAHDRQMVSHDGAQEIQRRVQALMKWVQYTQQGLILALGALLAIDGTISAGAMIASNALMGNALRPIGVIVQAWSQFVEARQATLRLDGLLNKHPDEAAEPPAQSVKGQISLRDLVATAPQRKLPILQGLNADFVAGEVVAIVGPSGAGKSTLARCLLGIWPDTSGAVLLDGHDVRDWPREQLGPHIGYLPQDIELFEGTIAENIARFSNASPSTIIEAATRVGIHDMVLRLPDGYDTTIGEAGSLLSGGQRQRLGLARAILGSPSIVVLDEPNANLDDAGEGALVRVLLDMKRKGTTVFMVVHQPQVLVTADRVLMMENGRISKLAKVVLAPPAPAVTSQIESP